MFEREPWENIRILPEAYEGEEDQVKLAEYITKLRKRMECALSLARESSEHVQKKLKEKNDKKIVVKYFEPGDYVFMFSPIKSRPLQARF